MIWTRRIYGCFVVVVFFVFVFFVFFFVFFVFLFFFVVVFFYYLLHNSSPDRTLLELTSLKGSVCNFFLTD